MTNVKELHRDVNNRNGNSETPGTSLDVKGEAITPRRSFMETIDSKAKEQVTLSKGTLWLIATVFILAQVMFNYGSSIVGWARSDEGQSKDISTMRTQIDETRTDVQRLNEKFDKLQESLTQQAIQDAKVQGFKAGVAETQSDKGK